MRRRCHIYISRDGIHYWGRHEGIATLEGRTPTIRFTEVPTLPFGDGDFIVSSLDDFILSKGNSVYQNDTKCKVTDVMIKIL
jgi:hypothetical protein